jgi:hypothetical protein
MEQPVVVRYGQALFLVPLMRSARLEGRIRESVIRTPLEVFAVVGKHCSA